MRGDGPGERGGEPGDADEQVGIALGHDFLDVLGRAVCGGDRDFVGDFEVVEDFLGFFYDGHIRLRPKNNMDFHNCLTGHLISV